MGWASRAGSRWVPPARVAGDAREALANVTPGPNGSVRQRPGQLLEELLGGLDHLGVDRPVREAAAVALPGEREQLDEGDGLARDGRDDRDAVREAVEPGPIAVGQAAEHALGLVIPGRVRPVGAGEVPRGVGEVTDYARELATRQLRPGSVQDGGVEPRHRRQGRK